MDTAKTMAMMATDEGDLWDYVPGGTGKRQSPVSAPLPGRRIITAAGTGKRNGSMGRGEQ
jgi:alcohol dehydrogenase